MKAKLMTVGLIAITGASLLLSGCACMSGKCSKSSDDAAMKQCPAGCACAKCAAKAK